MQYFLKREEFTLVFFHIFADSCLISHDVFDMVGLSSFYCTFTLFQVFTREILLSKNMEVK